MFTRFLRNLGGTAVRIARILAAIALVVAPLTASADGTLRFGVWFVTPATNDGSVAGTINDSGDVFGETCDSSATCHWFLAMGTVCEPGSRYPVLANADSGAVPLQVVCMGKLDTGLYRYIFSGFDQVDAIVKKDPRVGFAFPMQGDQFKVVRFGLTGATNALYTLKQAALKNVVPTVTGGTDQTL